MKRSTDPALSRAVSAPASAPNAINWSMGAVFALLLTVTLIAYFPALNGSLLWDDAGHVTSPALQSWSGLFRIWFEPGVTQQYYPLLHSAFWIEHRLWGDATIGYHLINVLWHATSSCLLAAILRRLAVTGAVLAALVFALHPVGVESVAWIAEQKNTLSTVFYLAAALAWLRFEEDRRPALYASATLLFVAALLTKSVTATLPAALLVIAWWRHGRLSWRREVLPLLPWLVIGVAAGIGTSWLENVQIGAKGAAFDLSPIGRCLLAGRVAWFYLAKLIWPAGLTFFYPHWTIDAGVAWQWVFPAATLTVLIVAAWWSRRDRGPLAAALLFGGTLMPVLGFVNVYPFVFSYVADHFQYLASIGMIAFLTAVAARGFGLLRWPRWTGPTTAVGVLLLLGSLTWRQSGMYRDVFSLYEATLTRNPASWTAHLNLGTALDEAGRTEEGLAHLQKALALKPHNPDILNSLGNVLNRLGRPGEARPLLEEAIQLQPRFATAYNTLGASLMALGQTDAGQSAFQKALEVDPNFTLARVNLGWALANTGHGAAALEQFELASRQQPDLADAEFKWGLALMMADRAADALPHFVRATTLDPNYAPAEYFAGAMLLHLNRAVDAVPHLERALALDGDYALAHLQLALALRALGHSSDADEHYQAAIRLDPALAH